MNNCTSSQLPRITCFGRRPAEELYDMEGPPSVEELAGEAEFAEVMSSLRRTMEDHLRATGDPRTGGEPGITTISPIRGFSQPTMERGRAWGFPPSPGLSLAMAMC